MNALEFDPEKNVVATGRKVNVTGHITGSGNRIHIADARNPSNIHIDIHGDGNVIHIAEIGRIRELQIAIGSNFPAHNASLEIAENFSSEENCRFLLYNTGNVCRIGKNCMFSNSITIRCGDMPHLLFDRETGEYLDRSEGVFIGDHVWVGEGVYLTKRASIADESVIGAMSVALNMPIFKIVDRTM